MAKIALALPVLGFLAACFLRRRAIAAIIHARRTRALTHLPPLTSWFLGAAVIGAASFAFPRLKLEPWAQGVTLLLAQGVITLVVMNAVRDVVLVIVDITMIFEGVAARLDRLVMPMLAFLSTLCCPDRGVRQPLPHRRPDHRCAAVRPARPTRPRRFHRRPVLQRRHHHHAGLRRHRAEHPSWCARSAASRSLPAS